MLRHYNPAGRFRIEKALGHRRMLGVVPAGTVLTVGGSTVLVDAFLPREIKAWRRDGAGWASTFVGNATDRVACRRLSDGTTMMIPYHALLWAWDEGGDLPTMSRRQKRQLPRGDQRDLRRKNQTWVG